MKPTAICRLLSGLPTYMYKESETQDELDLNSRLLGHCAKLSSYPPLLKGPSHVLIVSNFLSCLNAFTKVPDKKL